MPVKVSGTGGRNGGLMAGDCDLAFCCVIYVIKLINSWIGLMSFVTINCIILWTCALNFS